MIFKMQGNSMISELQTLDAGLHSKTDPKPTAVPREGGDGLAVPPPTPPDGTSKFEVSDRHPYDPASPENLKTEQVREETKTEEMPPVNPEEDIRSPVDAGQIVPERCDSIVPRETPVEEKGQLPSVMDNYYPHQPPEYAPPLLPQTGAPGMPQERSPPSAQHVPPRSLQSDFNSAQRRSEGEQQQVRGHVEDGVYTRPASSSNAQILTPSPAAATAPMNNSGNKQYERRNKKRRPPDYYKRFEPEVNPMQPQVPQVVGYHPVPAVSVRQAMESSPASAGYVGLPGTQQPSVMSSQYGPQIPVSYPVLTSMMNPMHPQAVQQMQMQMQRHQQQVQGTTQQYLAQQEMARLMSTGYPYHIQHVAQNPVFHQQPQVGSGNHGNMGGMAQPPPGRPLAMSPSGLSPSMQPPQIGRSPPRGPPMATQQYQDPRSMDHHGYHQQHPQASPNVPMNHIPQVAIQTSLNSNNFNQSSSNPVHKDVTRTGGQRMPVNVILSQQPSQNLGNYAPPPQPHGQIQQPQQVPHKVAAAPTHNVPVHLPLKMDTQHQGMGPGNQKSAAPAPQSDVKPVSPEQVKEQAPVVVEVPPVISQVEAKKSPSGPQVGQTEKRASPLRFLSENVNIVMDSVVDKDIKPQTKVGDSVTESKKDKDERTSVKPSFSGPLTFGTVQDIATMNAQSTEVGQKFKQNEEPKKTDNAPNKPIVIPKAPKTPATAPVVSVETIKAVAEPEEFHDAPLPPEDPVVQAQPAPVGYSGAATTATPTTTASSSTANTTSALNSSPVTNSSAPPSVNKQNEPGKQSEAKLGVSEAPSVPATEPMKPKVVWASLFKNETKPAPPSPAPEPKPSPVNNAKPTNRKSEEKDDKKPVPIDEDSKARKLGGD